MKKSICFTLALTLIGATLFSPSSLVSAKNQSHKNTIQKSYYNVSDWIKDSDVCYPITTNDADWADIKTHDEMVKKTTLPNELLNELTTDELIDLALEYPLLCDMYAYDTIQQGLDALSYQNPIIKELINREDGASKLLNKYENVEITDELHNDTASNKRNINNDDLYLEFSQELFEVTFLESILAQEDVLSELDDNDLDKLFDTVYDKIEEKNDSPLYDGSSITTFFNVLDETNSELYDQEVTTSTDSKSSRATTSYVYTPKGTKVPVVKNTYFGIDQTNALDARYKKAYPNATFKSSSTNMYNCHSYAWYSTSQTRLSGVWMNNPTSYMTDKSYTKVGTKPTANKQKVVYVQYPLNNPFIHSGIVSNYSKQTIISKWGQAPLMEHAVNYSPYNAGVNYYKR